MENISHASSGRNDSEQSGEPTLSGGGANLCLLVTSPRRWTPPFFARMLSRSPPDTSWSRRRHVPFKTVSDSKVCHVSTRDAPRHEVPSRRSSARPDDQLPGGPALPDDFLRLQRQRPRRPAVRSPRVREHLHPPDEPNDRRPRKADRRTRRRFRGARGRLGTGGRIAGDHEHRAGGPEHRLRLEPLRRDVQPLPLHVSEVRDRLQVRRRGRSVELREGDRREDPLRLHRGDGQPAGRHSRLRSDRQGRPRCGHSADRRCDARLARAVPSVRAWGRHRRP